MKKVALNFWIDVVLLIVFTLVIASGVVLHRFPYEMSENLLLGVTRYEWGSLHWMFSLILFGLIWLHLILHWDWEKFNTARYLKIGTRTLIVVVVFLLVIFAFIVPSCLTDEFPSRKDFKQTYPKTATHAMKT